MEARLGTWAALAVVGCLFSSLPSTDAGGYKTQNFEIAAPSPALAREIGEAAEAWRSQLAVEWLGEELPAWSKPCPIHARVAPNLGAGGATSFIFDRGEVFGWRMNIQGSRERILDSVLPHEITHTIFASHFRQPLPRWADEGACTTVEHPSEIAKQERMLIQFLKTQRGIPFDQMFRMKEYPDDVMPLYSQGHSLAQMLIELRGKSAFLEFLADGMQDENWPRAVQQHYGYRNLLTLQNNWLEWVRDGRPRLERIIPGQESGIELVAANGRRNRPAPAPIYRGQSPEPSTTSSTRDLLPTSPVEPLSTTPQRETTPVRDVTPLTPRSSVYAELAAQAKRAPQTARPGRIYDASRGGTTIRR